MLAITIKIKLHFLQPLLGNLYFLSWVRSSVLLQYSQNCATGSYTYAHRVEIPFGFQTKILMTIITINTMDI